MSGIRSALVLFSLMSSAAPAFAQEPTSSTRPERFLMLLKPGDKLSWLMSTELNAYRLSVYTESRFAEIVKERSARREEIKKLEADFNGKVRSFSASDVDSKDPEVQRRVQDMRRAQQLRATRPASDLGTVAFVGQDYIAVVPLDDESRELLIPAWKIADIGRSKETK